MKKILFAAATLDIGGIETALVTLINYLSEEKDENNNYKYDITLTLEKKCGIFLNTLNKRIHIIEYSPNNSEIKFIRKFINLIKQIIFKMKYGNKFDFAASYATYSLPASFVARSASKNSALWCHMDYFEQFNGNKEKVKEFFNEKHYKSFKRLIFVSKRSKERFENAFPEMKEKLVFINNLIDYNKIERQSEEKVVLNEISEDSKITFLNIGRHDEEQKKLSRIIEATNILKEQYNNFKIIFIGDGKDTKKYEESVKKYNLQKYIVFLGRKKNPYPYLKKSDCVILTSDYEGSPVVFTEAMVLNKPIITTNVSGSEQLDGKYGIIVNKDIKEIADAMENYILSKYTIKEKFDYKKYNDEIISKLSKIM